MFQKGDVVQVRGGGPMLTVFDFVEATEAKPATFGSDDSEESKTVELTPAVAEVKAQAHCVWFTDAGEIRAGFFALYLIAGPWVQNTLGEWVLPADLSPPERCRSSVECPNCGVLVDSADQHRVPRKAYEREAAWGCHARVGT